MNFSYSYSVKDKASKKAIDEMQGEEDQKIFDSLKSLLEVSIVTEPADKIETMSPAVETVEVDSWNFPFDRWDFV